MKKLIAVLTLITLVLAAQAQPTQDSESKDRHAILKYPKVKPRKKKKIAEQLIKEGSYYNAAEYLEDVLKDKPDNMKIVHQLALINESLRDYKAAEKYYRLELDKDPNKWPNDKFNLGHMQQMNGKYDDAKKSYQDYLKTDLGKDEKSYKALAKIGIEGCDSSVAWLANPNKIRVDHEDAINRVTTEGSPKVLRGGRIMYATMHSDTATVITGNKKDYYSQIYTARKQGKDWVEIAAMPFPPNDANNHVANGILTNDEKTLYFTKCDQSEIVKMKCKIYRCTKNGAEWNNAEEVKELNSPTYTTTQPAFGQDKDGKPIMYFVSDRGGKGGLDIFYAPMDENGKFGAIKNAGTEVNTPGDDRSPFYDAKNKVLYYSTDGRPSLGGLDVYKIPGQPDNWGVASNVGAPVNSQADDWYYALDENGKKGYVVSNRIGTKTIRGETSGDDIWSVSVKEDIVLKGIFALRNDPSLKPIDGVDASMYHVNGSNFEFLSNTITTKDPFYFTLKRGQSYKINGNKDGLWPAVENINIKDDEDRDTITQVFLIDPIIRKRVKIENIYFAFDKASVLDFYKEKMDSVISVMMQNPGYSVEVQGHTDSKGSDQYNEKLSQKRADEAAQYLESKGVAKERIVTKAMGKSMPIAPNELDGKDDPEGRAQNRRVEFKLIPDKPENAPDVDYEAGKPIKATLTGPGYTTPERK
jgi:outer membrane protein OmpA-like peptidoglycan-associated protein/tetratricopeptide (TPR) repeat protein